MGCIAMQASEGAAVSFNDYLTRTARPRARPVIWRADTLVDCLASATIAERGAIALIDPEAADAATIAPGLSCVVQVVPPGGKTSSHAHSFWHLFLVRAGFGCALFENDGSENPLREGDIFFVPAWCSHAFVNSRDDAPLIMLVIQNLPSLAAVGTLARHENNQPIHVVYAE